MQPFGVIWKSTIFQKWVMAVTGILLVLFLLGHLSGNLLVFLGAEHINAYGVELRELLHGSAIWVMRAGLIVIFVLHVRAGIILAARNRTAAGVNNSKIKSIKSTISSRSMVYTGILMLVYVFYHLAHFTWGAAHSQYYHYVDELGRHDVYRMVVESFRDPTIVATYTVAMLVTGLHLSHAVSSAFQTMGVSNARFKRLIKTAGPVLAVVLIVGFLSVPFAVLSGLVK